MKWLLEEISDDILRYIVYYVGPILISWNMNDKPIKRGYFPIGKHTLHQDLSYSDSVGWT